MFSTSMITILLLFACSLLCLFIYWPCVRHVVIVIVLVVGTYILGTVRYISCLLKAELFWAMESLVTEHSRTHTCPTLRIFMFFFVFLL